MWNEATSCITIVSAELIIFGLWIVYFMGKELFESLAYRWGVDPWWETSVVTALLIIGGALIWFGYRLFPFSLTLTGTLI